MNTRRQFIKKTGIISLGLLGGQTFTSKSLELNNNAVQGNGGFAISTWKSGLKANEAAWEIISKGGRALDAVEAGVKVIEADPEDMSVGYGGRPDKDGHVTLDASIMDENGNCGSVCFLQHIKHPVSVARLVMEKTPHVILAGNGALNFALEMGFKKENLLTEKAKQEWKEWLRRGEYKPVINIENHDTIGILAIDNRSNISGACSTSGIAYKMHGRVGDSPIIGAGMFCDNEVGGAVATGTGELVLKTLGTFLIVELMRNGASPQEAVEEAIKRTIRKITYYKQHQVGYLAIDKKGNIGAYSIQPGFNFAFHNGKENSMLNSASHL